MRQGIYSLSGCEFCHNSADLPYPCCESGCFCFLYRVNGNFFLIFLTQTAALFFPLYISARLSHYGNNNIRKLTEKSRDLRFKILDWNIRRRFVVGDGSAYYEQRLKQQSRAIINQRGNTVAVDSTKLLKIPAGSGGKLGKIKNSIPVGNIRPKIAQTRC